MRGVTLRIEIDGSAEVRPAEPFEVAIASGLATGAVTTVEAPDGVELIAEEDVTPTGFGASGCVVYRFCCSRPGDYVIHIRRGRPWEADTQISTVGVHCLARGSRATRSH